MPKVRDILARKGSVVHTIHRGATVLEAVRKMDSNCIGALLVMSGEAIVGILTEHDVLARVVAAGCDPATVRVGDVMTSSVAYCTPATPLDEIRDICTAKRYRYLPVMERDTLVGLISTGDVLAFESGGKEHTIHYLTTYTPT